MKTLRIVSFFAGPFVAIMIGYVGSYISIAALSQGAASRASLGEEILVSLFSSFVFLLLFWSFSFFPGLFINKKRYLFFTLGLFIVIRGVLSFSNMPLGQYLYAPDTVINYTPYYIYKNSTSSGIEPEQQSVPSLPGTTR